MAVDRQESLLERSDYSFRRGASTRAAEVAGRTTAECAAVCCCCPCVLINVVLLAVYKVPAGICRKALRGKCGRWLMKRKSTQPTPPRKCSCAEQELSIRPPTTVESDLESIPKNTEVTELDKEMLEKFHSGGFWRSSSRKTDV